ncbi:uncharacterized protein LOC141663664 [Apium graveolens]|uniref:uncharacterized protein LOC141663664 n=1 Tax=Apium graveolens TaxID=4045 RepID=UPI003D7B4BC7
MTGDEELFRELDRLQVSKVIIGNSAHIGVKGKEAAAIESCRGKSFPLDPMEEEQAAYSAITTSAELWHKRMGHFHHAALPNMQRKDLAIGLPHIESELPDCNSCQYGKQARLPFQQATWRATEKV